MKKKKLNKHLAGRRLFNALSPRPLNRSLQDGSRLGASEAPLDDTQHWNIDVASFDDTVDLDAASELDANATIQSFDQEYDDDEIEDDDDEEGNESSDPIVLIEDYMRNHTSSMEPSPDPQDHVESVTEKNASVSDSLVQILNDAASDVQSTLSVSVSPDMCHLMARKRSIAAFKLKYHNHNQLACEDNVTTMSSTSPILSNNTSTSDDSCGLQASTANTSYSHTLLKKRSISAESYIYKSEDLQEIFGKIPGADLLKHCDLCDKPLYEVSSIIMNHSKKRAKKGVKSTTSSESDDLSPYLEFVCGDCIGMYETFLNEFLQQYLDEQQAQQNRARLSSKDAPKIIQSVEGGSRRAATELNIQVIIKHEDSQKEHKELSVLGTLMRKPCSDRLVKLFKDIQDKYDFAASQHPDAPNSIEVQLNASEREGFSPELISQFKHLNKHTSPNLLLKLIQSKFRWRWNYDGMVPAA